MKDGCKGPGLFRDSVEDLRGRADAAIVLRKDPVRFTGYWHIPELPCTDENDFGSLFIQEGKVVLGKRRMSVFFFPFPRFFLGAFGNAFIQVDDDIMIVADIIDLHPSVACLHDPIPRIGDYRLRDYSGFST